MEFKNLWIYLSQNHEKYEKFKIYFKSGVGLGGIFAWIFGRWMILIQIVQNSINIDKFFK
jgi:hypothetical protein